MVTFVALPLILQQFRAAGKTPDESTARELLNTARIYTPVPDGADEAYTRALLRTYIAFCERQESEG